MKPVIELTDTAFRLCDTALREKIANTNMSASTVTTLLECPGKWLMGRGILDEILPIDPLAPNVLGNVFHDCLEQFFRLPPSERDWERITQPGGIKDQVIDSVKSVKDDAGKWQKVVKYPEMRETPEAIAAIDLTIQNYIEMGSDPKKVNLAQLEVDEWGKTVIKDGLEIWVKADLKDDLGNKVPARTVIGAIDRLQSLPSDDSKLVVEDYKTGKTSCKNGDFSYNPNDRFADFSYLRQSIYYTMILEQTYDKKVVGSRLIYPNIYGMGKPNITPEGTEVKGVVVKNDVHNVEYRQKALSDLVDASKTLDNAIADDYTFKLKSSVLCSWCDCVNICPVAKPATKSNAVEARANKPNREDFIAGGII